MPRVPASRSNTEKGSAGRAPVAPPAAASTASATLDEETTQLLQAWQRGSADAGETLLRRLYPDLRRVAATHLRALDVSLEPSDLVNELYLRLAGQERVRWQSRVHFFALVSRLVRWLVADHVKQRNRKKRGARRFRVGLSEESVPIAGPDAELLALDRALEKLAEVDPLTVRVVELRHFAGLSIDETAQVLEMGTASVGRRWRFARAWLYEALGGEASADPA